MKGILEDRVAVITGSTRGIGRAIAGIFSRSGAKVVISGRKADAVEAVVGELRASGAECIGVPAHVGKKEDLEKLAAETLKAFGRIDILVNNAATNPVFCPILSVDEGAWDKIIDANLKGCFLLCRTVGKTMISQKRGVIVNVASTAGFSPAPGLGVYAVSKAGLIMLTKVLAAELAPFNIRANAVAPGLVKTKFSSALWQNEDILKRVLTHTPMGRTGEPEEIAQAVLFLASDASSFITGHTVVIDGGATI
ncbi:MAG: glucose 1-dehydrogenase [bacterium]